MDRLEKILTGHFGWEEDNAAYSLIMNAGGADLIDAVLTTHRQGQESMLKELRELFQTRSVNTTIPAEAKVWAQAAKLCSLERVK
jgi:hypothetical protein